MKLLSVGGDVVKDIQEHSQPFVSPEQEHTYYHKIWDVCCDAKLHKMEVEKNGNIAYNLGRMFDNIL